jgi:hypothetical protein
VLPSSPLDVIGVMSAGLALVSTFLGRQRSEAAHVGGKENRVRLMSIVSGLQVRPSWSRIGAKGEVTKQDIEMFTATSGDRNQPRCDVELERATKLRQQ